MVRIRLEFFNQALYHEDFFTPGIWPWVAISRKHMRQMPNSRIWARRLPQRKHRRTVRVLNFGFFFARAMTDFFAILVGYEIRNGYEITKTI